MPTKGKIPIEGLLDGYEAALIGIGYSITTKLLVVKRAVLMIRRYQNAGLVYFDQAIINRYTGEIDDKYFKGNMQKKHYERAKREIDCFVSYVRSGKSDALSSTLRGARQELTPEFERIAEEFIAGDFHPNTLWQKFLCRRYSTKSRMALRKQGGIWRTFPWRPCSREWAAVCTPQA